jgi:sulfur carrier protein
VSGPGVTIRLNGRELQVSEPTLAAALQSGKFQERKGVAAALNGRVVPKTQWAATPLAAGDTVLVIQATQGG